MKSILIDTDASTLELLSSYLGRIEDVEVIGMFTNPLDAIQLLNKNEIDVVILAIEMPFLNGIELFKNTKCASQFIFTSKDTRYHMETFKLNACDYLVKPIYFNNLISALSKARNRYKKDQTASINITPAGSRNIKANTESIVIETRANSVAVIAEDIKYIQTVKGVTKIYARKHGRPIIATSSKERIFVNLPDYFLQVHDSYIINTCLIQEVQKRKVIIEDMHIPLGKKYINKVVELLTY